MSDTGYGPCHYVAPLISAFDQLLTLFNSTRNRVMDTSAGGLCIFEILGVSAFCVNITQQLLIINASYKK